MGTYPEQSQENGRGQIPAVAEEDDKRGKEQGVSGRFLGVVDVGAVVQTSIGNLLMQDLVLAGNLLLDQGIQGGVDAQIILDLSFEGSIGNQSVGGRLLVGALSLCGTGAAVTEALLGILVGEAAAAE